MEDKNKCNTSSFCDAMQARLETDINYSGKGFVLLERIDINTRRTFPAGVKYQESGRKNITLLNFCPWCGARIDFISHRKDKN